MEIRDNRNKEWFWLDNEYLNGYARHLGMGCTVVYLSLCRYANNNTQQCFPSMQTIAEQNGIHRDTVLRALKKLEAWGIISIAKSKKDDGTQANNVYTLLSKKEWRQKPSSTEQHGVAPSSTELHNRVAQSDNNNTNINKTNNSNAQALQVSEIIRDFEKVNINAKNWYGHKTQRNACKELIEILGFERVKQIVSILPKTNKLSYVTTVTTPNQLLNDFSKLESQLTKLKNSKLSKVRKII